MMNLNFLSRPGLSSHTVTTGKNSKIKPKSMSNGVGENFKQLILKVKTSDILEGTARVSECGPEGR